MTTAPWYPITDQHPAPLVRVHGIVAHPGGVQDGYDAQILISRGNRPHHNLWASWQSGRATPLAPGARPDYWQPQQPDKWKAPLPEPVISREPRMWSAVGEREDLAAILPPEPEQWWRDPTRIRYTGDVTLDMAEGRVMRAVAACGHGYGANAQTRTFSSILADMAEENEFSAYPTSDYTARFRPLPQDIADFEVAMGWFTALNPPDLRVKGAELWTFNRPQKAIAYRALDRPWSYGKMADKFGMTPDGARKAHYRAIEAVHRVATGLPAYSHVDPIDQIAALQERNRMARGAA